MSPAQAAKVKTWINGTMDALKAWASQRDTTTALLMLAAGIGGICLFKYATVISAQPHNQSSHADDELDSIKQEFDSESSCSQNRPPYDQPVAIRPAAPDSQILVSSSVSPTESESKSAKEGLPIASHERRESTTMSRAESQYIRTAMQRMALERRQLSGAQRTDEYVILSSDDEDDDDDNDDEANNESNDMARSRVYQTDLTIRAAPRRLNYWDNMRGKDPDVSSLVEVNLHASEDDCEVWDSDGSLEEFEDLGSDAWRDELEAHRGLGASGVQGGGSWTERVMTRVDGNIRRIRRRR